MFASLAMLSAVLIVTKSLATGDFSFVVLSLELVTPLITSLVYNQRLIASWKLNVSSEGENSNWVIDLFTLASVVTALIYF